MEMQIEIVKVSPVYMDGKYPKMDLVFNREGKVQSRKIAGVGKSKEVLETLKTAKDGDVFDITLEKSDDGKYWNWEGAKKAEKQAAAEAAKSSYTTKSTYETPEERARKQVYIVRQSSLANAIEFYNAKGNKHTSQDVMGLAQEFADFVFQTERMDRATALAEKAAATVNKDKDFEDDIPF